MSYCKEKDVLFEELQHRISNSLQVIASILLMKAKTVQSEETRRHLQDTHKRVMSVAAVQEQVHALRNRRVYRNFALSFKIVRGSCNFNDWRQSANYL